MNQNIKSNITTTISCWTYTCILRYKTIKCIQAKFMIMGLSSPVTDN